MRPRSARNVSKRRAPRPRADTPARTPVLAPSRCCSGCTRQPIICLPTELPLSLAAPHANRVWVWVTSLLGVGLVFPLGAVADVPDVAIRVGEGSAVPAPLQLRRGREDLSARPLGLLQNFVDAVLAAHDVIEDDATKAAALRTQAHHVGESVAAVEADQGTAVWNEEHRDLVVVLDLPAQPFRIEASGSLHVIDAKQDRTDVRVHVIHPL